MDAKVPLLLRSAAVLGALLSFACTSDVDGGAYGASGPGSNGSGAAASDGSGSGSSDGSDAGSTGSGNGTGTGDSTGSGSGGSSSGTGSGNGSTSGGGGDGPVDLTPTFSCNESEVPDSVPLKRLSYVQYRNTLEDLVGAVLPQSRDVVLDELEPVLDRLPRDTRQGPDTAFAWFSRLDQTVQQSHVDEQYALSNAVAAALTSSEERLVELVGDCAVEASDGECLGDFIRRFGEYAQRRPLADEDVEFYAQGALEEPYGAADYADVAALLLASPYVMYTVEHGADGNEEPRAPLSAYELASKLSYQFWQTMPDEELFEAARTGDLLTESGFAAQVDRVVDDPKAERGIAEFFGQWLENPFLEDFDVRAGEDVYDAFLDGFDASSELKARMLQEVVDASIYGIREGQTFAEFFQSNRSFAVTDDLASIYGVEPWTEGEPPVFGDAEREGLLARAAFLATGLSDTRPIIKGVLIRKAILCESVDPPPADVANEPPPVSDGAVSTREAVEGKTATAVCRSCHVRLNDLGFVTENFDALGRFRTEQRLFDEDGNALGTVPVDTTAVPQVEADDLTEVTGIAGLNSAILASEKPYACFARQYFRFTNSRVENTARDGCALATLKDTLTGSGSLRDALRAIALERSFKEHTF
jgi:hypothetical protein